MKSSILKIYADNLATAHRLVDDLADERLCDRPHDGSKHPAWILSHLALASGMNADILAGNPDGLGGVPPEWAAVCAPGTDPQGDRGLYPSKVDMLAHLTRTHELSIDRFETATDDDLAAEFPIEAYRSFFPTVGDGVIYLMTHHEGWHLGQLAEWRAAAELPPVVATV